MEKIGYKVLTLRKKHGYTIRKLGELVSVHHTYISQIEKGKTKPSATTILKLADVFGISADQLMRDELELE